MTEHSLVLDIVIRFLRLLGCPHACGEKMVSFVTFFAVSGPTEHCSIFHFPPFVLLLRHRRDILTFLNILTVFTMKTIYFLNAYHLG